MLGARIPVRFSNCMQEFGIFAQALDCFSESRLVAAVDSINFEKVRSLQEKAPNSCRFRLQIP
jgi:hypothetical protein